MICAFCRGTIPCWTKPRERENRTRIAVLPPRPTLRRKPREGCFAPVSAARSSNPDRRSNCVNGHRKCQGFGHRKCQGPNAAPRRERSDRSGAAPARSPPLSTPCRYSCEIRFPTSPISAPEQGKHPALEPFPPDPALGATSSRSSPNLSPDNAVCRTRCGSPAARPPLPAAATSSGPGSSVTFLPPALAGLTSTPNPPSPRAMIVSARSYLFDSHRRKCPARSGVDCQGTTVAPQVLDDRPAVIRTVVARHEPRRHQPAGRVVADRDRRMLPPRPGPLASGAQSRPTAPVRPAPPAGDAAFGVSTACDDASRGPPPASIPAACPGSPAPRSSAPSAPRVASARNPDTSGSRAASSGPLPNLRRQRPVRTPTTRPALTRPRRPPPRMSGAAAGNGARSPPRADPSAALNTPSFTCLSTEMRSLSLRLNSIRYSPGSRSITNRTRSVRGSF